MSKQLRWTEEKHGTKMETSLEEIILKVVKTTSWKKIDQEILLEPAQHKIDVCTLSETMKTDRSIIYYQNYSLVDHRCTLHRRDINHDIIKITSNLDGVERWPTGINK